MEENFKITEHEFSKHQISLVDSFVLTKLGEGHGESTLYLGGKNKVDEINDFFENESFNTPFQAFLLTSNLLKILGFYRHFYMNPHDFYCADGHLISFKHDLPKILQECEGELNAASDLISFYAELLTPDSQGRIYLRVSHDSFLRKFFLPYAVRISFKKIYFTKKQKQAMLINCVPYFERKLKNLKRGGKSLTVEFNYLNKPY